MLKIVTEYVLIAPTINGMSFLQKKDTTMFTVEWLTVAPAAESPTAGEAVEFEPLLPMSVQRELHDVQRRGLSIETAIELIAEYEQRKTDIYILKKSLRFQDKHVEDLEDQLAAAHEATAEAVRENGRLRAAVKEFGAEEIPDFEPNGIDAMNLRMSIENIDQHIKAEEQAVSAATNALRSSRIRLKHILWAKEQKALAPTDAANTNTGSE